MVERGGANGAGDAGRSDRPAFPLFRAALEGQNDQAWAALQARYDRLIAAWLLRRLPLLSNADLADLQQQVWIRFWRNLDGVRLGERFPHEGALLKYLKRCTGTIALDQRRGWRRAAQNQAQLIRQAQAAYHWHLAQNKNDVVEHVQRQEQLRRVRRWLRRHIVDERDRLVLALSFDEGLSPTEVAARHPALFSGPEEVSRIKERIIRRARRSLL